MSENLVTLEQDARFSKSLLWQYQKDYFVRKGVNAWAHGDVPFYVTSNMVIAYSYAQMVLRYLQDHLANGTLDPKEPIYMLELATGSGKFSYLFLYCFSQFLQLLKLDYLKFHYVMTDFTDNNLRYWQQHERLQPYINNGMLDFAIFTIGETQNVELINSKVTLTENSCKNPLIIVGNYTFDTVPHDLFKVTDGKIEAGLLSIKSPQDNVIPGSVSDLERLQTDFTYQEVSLPYYHNKNIDSILETYLANIKESTFLVPTGAIEAIDSLRKLSNNRMLILSCDKGYSSLDSFNNLGTPHIAFHGSFSMMVNFDFIGRYIKNIGGDSFVAEDHEGTKVSVFCLGNKFNELPNLTWAHDQFNNHLATNEFLLIKNFLIRDTSQLDLEHVLALLKFSYWDCDIFFSVASRLAQIANQASPGFLRAIRHGLVLLDEHYYFIKNYKNIPFEIAHIYQVIGDLDNAIKFYQQTADLFGEESPIFFNMGLCYYYKNDLLKAHENFKKAHDLNPSNSSAKEWIGHVSKELEEKGS